MREMSKENKIRKSSEETDSDVEEETLALHRLDTLPSNRFGQEDRQRYHKEDIRYGIDDEFDGSEGDEEAFLRDADLEATAALRANRAANEAKMIDKTGRPEWLKESIYAARSSKRVRICFGLGLITLLILIFTFAFGSSGDEGDGRLHRVYHWAGDIWHSDNKQQPVNHTFPIDVGYPGPTEMGKPPALADEDKFTGDPARGNSPIQTTIPEVGRFELFKHMGNMSPYFSAPDFGISTQKFRALAKGCRTERVHILHRHGSRYPTTSSSANLIRKLFRDMKGTLHFSGPLEFLNTYDPERLGLELLVPLGRQQLFESGVQHQVEYGNLIDTDLKDHGKLFIRAGSQQRIVDSAIAFMQGMFAQNWTRQADLEVQIEAPKFNTTLAPNFACPRAGRAETEPGLAWGRDWYNEYLKGAVQRLKPYAKGVELDGQLLNAMQQLCSYDTVAFGRSDFCGLFTEQEWLDYEYFWDLNFYGSYGAGSEVGKAQGVGWVNEFMARLTKTPWNESTITSENSTFNNDPQTFPIDRRFYADFSHDSVLTNVLAALNLEEFNQPLDLHRPDPRRKFRTSTIAPYAGRFVFEEILCEKPKQDIHARWFGKGSGSGSRPVKDLQIDDGNEHLIRLLINEAIVDLHQLKGCDSRPDGMCQRDQFIRALAGRNEWAQWNKCFD